MKRRHFLLEAASCLPCCLLPGDFVRRAAAALEAGDTTAALAAPTRAATTLYALHDGDRYLLSLDSAAIEPRHLSWRDWADLHDANPDDPKAFREFALEWGLLDESETLDCLFSSPDDLIPSGLQSDYLDGSWACSDSPRAQAHHYLFGLDLGNSSSAEGGCLGELKFYEGPCPGSNWTWVETDDGLILASLQRRLLELGEDTRLEVHTL